MASHRPSGPGFVAWHTTLAHHTGQDPRTFAPGTPGSGPSANGRQGRKRKNPGVVESRGPRRSVLVAGRGFEPLTFGL